MTYNLIGLTPVAVKDLPKLRGRYKGSSLNFPQHLLTLFRIRLLNRYWESSGERGRYYYYRPALGEEGGKELKP